VGGSGVAVKESVIGIIVGVTVGARVAVERSAARLASADTVG